MEVLQDEYQRVNGNYVDLAKWFGEDPGKMDSGEFFALLSVSHILTLLHLAAPCKLWFVKLNDNIIILMYP